MFIKAIETSTLESDYRFSVMISILQFVNGEHWADGYLVHDYGIGTLDDEEQVWIIGDWNREKGEKLAAIFESMEVSVHFYDEAESCSSCYRLMETTPSTMWWRPPYIWFDGDGYVCFQCAASDLPSVLEQFTIFPSDLSNSQRESLPHELLGFVPYELGSLIPDHPELGYKPRFSLPDGYTYEEMRKETLQLVVESNAVEEDDPADAYNQNRIGFLWSEIEGGGVTLYVVNNTD